MVLYPGWNKDGVGCLTPSGLWYVGTAESQCPFVQQHHPPVRTRKPGSREASHLHRSHGRLGFLTLHHSRLYTFCSIFTEVWCFIKGLCVFWGGGECCLLFVWGVLCLFRCFPVISGNNFCFCFSGDIALKKESDLIFNKSVFRKNY